MTATTIQDLRLLICEDEYLLAIDMAQQLSALGAKVVGIARSTAEIKKAVAAEPFEANAAVVDVHLAEGVSYEGITLLTEAGAAVVVCSGYSPDQRPADFANIAWVGKPARAEDVAAALCSALDARGANQIV